MGSRLKKKQGSGPAGGWEIVYTGFVLILLSFFIMMCSFATMEESKITRFVRSFSTALNILAGGLKFEPGDIELRESPSMIDETHALANILNNLMENLDKTPWASEVELSDSPEGIILRLNDCILFDLGSAAVREEAVEPLTRIGRIIQNLPNQIRIEGHTDNLQINTYRYASNWELSAARAVSVLRFFLERFSIESSRLSAAGFAEFKPLEPNDTPEHRARNRRVEIYFLDTDGYEPPAADAV